MHHVLRISLVVAFLASVAALLSPRSVVRASRDKIFELRRWLDAPTSRNRIVAFTLIWIVALFPMLYLTHLVRHYAVEVPTLDDWEMAPLIIQAHTGHLYWAEIFAQQQEARTVLPKLIFILSAADGHWDVRDQMMLSVICCWLTATGIFILLCRSELRTGAIAICFWLAVLAIFTPAKFELWLFASGFPSFFPALFLVSALVVTGTDRIAPVWKFILCATLATASTFSLPNGLLAWALTFPTLLLTQSIPRRRNWLLAWIGTTALCAAVYFWGYQKPPGMTAFAPAVSWREYAGFILEFLGGSLAYAWKDRPALAALLFGLVQLTIFGAAIVYCVWKRVPPIATQGLPIPVPPEPAKVAVRPRDVSPRHVAPLVHGQHAKGRTWLRTIEKRPKTILPDRADGTTEVVRGALGGSVPTLPISGPRRA